MKTSQFSTQWWKSFLKDSDNLTKTLLKKNALGDVREQLARFSEETLRIALGQNLPDKTFRLWVNDAPVTDKSITGKYLNDDTQPVVEKMLDDKGAETVGIILNYCENLHEDFKLLVGKLFKPLLIKHGMPTHGIEISLFSGNYSRTPIGFHLDQRGHRVIHLQVGPGVKEMYLIPKEVYEKDLFHITQGQKSFRDVDVLTPHAKRYVIEPGDIFFMPHGYYHVGKNIDYSTSITIWLENMQTEGLAEKLVVPIIRKIFTQEDMSLIVNDNTSAEQTDFLFKYLRKMVGSPKVLKWTVEELLRDVLQDFKYKLHSNNFFVPGYSSENPVMDISVKDSVQWQEGYELLTRKNGDMREFYFKGLRFTFFNNKATLKLIALLKRGKPVKVKSLTLLLNKEWDSNVSMEFIKELLSRGVITKL